MMYFVPSWYDPIRPWYMTDRTWFKRNEIIEFDDIISQLRIFLKSDQDSELLVLNYKPHLRRFLYRQNIMEAKYWSLFDEIQGLQHDYVHPMNYLLLNWPSDISFHYNPYNVTVLRRDELYARIYLSQDGTLLSVLYYKQELAKFEHVYDDRGFLSSILMYDEQGLPNKQNYLNTRGDWILSEDIKTNQIQISKKFRERFRHANYASWEELMLELLTQHLSQHHSKNDLVVLSLNEQHNQLILDSLTDHSLILSLSEERISTFSDALYERASMVFQNIGNIDPAQNQPSNYQNFKQQNSNNLLDTIQLPHLQIFPYDDHIAFGDSSKEANLIVSFYIDNIEVSEIEEAVSYIATHMERNEKVTLQLCTFQYHSFDFLQQVNQIVTTYNDQLRELEQVRIYHTLISANLGESQEHRIRVVLMNRSQTVSQMIVRSRLLIDLGNPILFRMKVLAFSAGVPQINRVANTYGVHKKNHYLLHTLSELEQALDYYLIGLKHWNDSLIYITSLREYYSNANILKRWNELQEADQ